MRDKDGVHTHWYYGGVASLCAVCFTHPIDLVRIQKQAHLQQISASEVIKLIMKYRGITGLYFGIKSALQRQISYTATRFAIYNTAKEYGLATSFWSKITVGGACGFVVGLVTAPMEKVHVHVHADAIRPMSNIRGYKNAKHGVQTLYAKGGIRNLYNVALPSGFRGLFFTVGQFSVYDQVKENLIDVYKFADNWKPYFIASLIAGGIATVISTPFEVVKMVAMNTELDQFQGCRHVAIRIAQLHGFKGFYKGLIFSFFRIVPQTVLTYLIYEQLCLHFGIHDHDER